MSLLFEINYSTVNQIKGDEYNHNGMNGKIYVII